MEINEEKKFIPSITAAIKHKQGGDAAGAWNDHYAAVWKDYYGTTGDPDTVLQTIRKFKIALGKMFIDIERKENHEKKKTHPHRIRFGRRKEIWI